MPNHPPSHPWLKHLTPASFERPRLVVIPYAGGGPNAFRLWAGRLGQHLDVWALHAPGREGRLSEPAIRDWPAWLAGAESGLARLGGVYRLWGHSLGAMAAFQLTARAERAGLPVPMSLVLSGCAAPGTRTIRDADSEDDAALTERLVRLGGTPQAVLESPEIMALLLPTLRADFRLAADFVPMAGTRLTTAITAIGGIDDPFATPAQMAEWQSWTTGAFSQAVVPGGHFFPFGRGGCLVLADALT